MDIQPTESEPVEGGPRKIKGGLFSKSFIFIFNNFKNLILKKDRSKEKK